MKNGAAILLSLISCMSFLAQAEFVGTKTETGLRFEGEGLVRTVTFYGPRTVRVNTNRGANFDKNGSLTVIAKPWSGARELVVDCDKATGALTFKEKDGKVILREKGAPAVKEVTIAGAPTYEAAQTWAPDTDEAIYGFGQCASKFFNLRGRKVRLIQTNIPAVVPVLTSSKGWGILWDEASQSWFEDGAEGMTLKAESAPAGADYYLMAGRDLDATFALYDDLTGRPPMFPKKAFGFFMSKEKYKSADELVGVVEKFRANHYPIDFIVQDWQYWEPAPGMWNAMTWDPKRYPDPKALCATLHDKEHVLLMNSIWPSVGIDSDLGHELAEKGLLFKPLHWITKKARVYDAYSAEGRAIYFKHLKKGLLDVGVDATWMDGTEVETLTACHSPDEMDKDLKAMGANAMGDFTRYLNSYSLLTTKGTYEGQRATSDKRVLTLTRSCWAGQQRYGAMPWSGDTTSSWKTYLEQISGGLSASLSGIPFWTQDTGGFFVNTKKGNRDPAFQELLARWNQFAVFNPVYRWHGTSIEREPYLFKDFAPEMYDSYLKACRLRYRLFPYVYALARRATDTGYTMTRPLVMDFAADPAARGRFDAFMFGPALLVAPVNRAMYHVEEPVPDPVDTANLTTPDGQLGVKVDYFRGENFNEFASGAVEPKVDFTWPGPPLVGWPAGLAGGEHFSVRVTGFVTATETGEYRIGLEIDDGARLILGGRTVIDDWNFGAKRCPYAFVTLKAGERVPFTIEYMQGSQERCLRFVWETPAQRSIRAKTVASLNNIMNVALPAGMDWYDFWTGTFHRGGETVAVACPLDRFPLFARAGSILPLGPAVEYVDEKTDAPTELRVYAGKDAAFALYDDDGRTYAYEKGESATIPLAWNEASKTLTIGARRGTFPGVAAKRNFTAVLVTPDGKASAPVAVDYDGTEKTIRF